MRALSIVSAVILPSFGQGASIASIPLEPSRVSCDAQYNTPCSRLKGEWLAKSLLERRLDYAMESDFFADITSKTMNYDTGFYPFVFDKESMVSVAHGWNENFLGTSLSEIFVDLGLGFASADVLFARFLAAANETQGGWVQYVWRERVDQEISSKAAYIVSLDASHFLGVGYRDQDFPKVVPYTDAHDGWCAIQNVQSLVGKAQYHLQEVAVSDASFDAALVDVSFGNEFKIDGGFYLFVYAYDGPLVAHGVLHDYLGWTLADIFIDLDRREDGATLHRAFVKTAEMSEGWRQYSWTNSRDSPPFTKIAYISKVTFGHRTYYIGSGFNFAREEGQHDCSDDYNIPCAFQTTLALSSHALAHAVSSPRALSHMWSSLTIAPSFRIGEFYVFAYDFNGTCVAHGDRSDFVGRTLVEVFELVNLSLDAGHLHELFRTKALGGGGFVEYDWLKPGVPDSDFLKISYMTHVHLDSRDYYIGVGFSNVQAPRFPSIGEGSTQSGDPVKCSRKYSSTCSALNVQSVLGQALSDLTMASSGARVTESGSSRNTFHYVLSQINLAAEDYGINDFFVSVFLIEGCSGREDDGCAVAYGGNSSAFLGKGWQQILDEMGITSIRGDELHRRLVEISFTGGGPNDVPWSTEFGRARTKKLWANQVLNEGMKYYVTSDFIADPLPMTCDACPSGTRCTKPDQEYCEDTAAVPFRKSRGFKALLCLLLIGLPLTCCFCHFIRLRNSERHSLELLELKKRHAEEMKKQLHGMMKVTHNMPDKLTFVENKEPQLVGVWYWEEDAEHVRKHKSDMIEPNTNFVQYSSQVSGQIEHSYQLRTEGKGFSTLHLDLSNKITSTPNGGKINNPGTGNEYDIDFDNMVQMNSKSHHCRRIFRKELTATAMLPFKLPSLPVDVGLNLELSDKESGMLMVSSGQIVQVTKVLESKEWMYGTVLYDPKLVAAQKTKLVDKDLEEALSEKLHGRQLTGWFPACLVEEAESEDMKTLMTYFGGKDSTSLLPPIEWTKDEHGCYNVGRVVVPWGSPECNSVIDAFNHGFHQNKHLFAGRNGTRFGHGSYFARDSSYSCGFSNPDKKGFRRMFLCRVVVGDYSLGQPGIPTPDLQWTRAL